LKVIGFVCGLIAQVPAEHRHLRNAFALDVETQRGHQAAFRFFGGPGMG
jgi:hypothetical protein